MERIDPLGPEFYAPLGIAEKITSVAFYLAGALSIAVLLVERATSPGLYDALQATFVVMVVLLIAGGLIVRTYFGARAHTNRIADFVSNAFAIPLIARPSTGYYNTSGDDPYLRMGAALLENTLFSAAIVRRMLVFERLRIAVYLMAWLWAVVFRATDLGLLVVAAQVVFSEQLVSKWIRMEWLRSTVEGIYEDTYRLFRAATDINAAEFRARVVEGVVRYETGKAQAGLSLSSPIFNQLNDELSLKWKALEGQLGIKGSVTGKP